MDAARLVELEEERILMTRAKGSSALPPMHHFVKTGLSASTIRSYVRETIVPEAIKRLYDMGMGLTSHDTVVGFEIVKMEAPPAVQRGALMDLARIGVPSPKPGDDGLTRIPGILVLGELELGKARARAAQARVAEHGPVAQIGRGGYVAPEGHEVVVVEENFESPSRSDENPTVAARPRKPSKHQSIAEKRRARLKTRSR